jgi:hypothetical protein
MLRPTRIAPLLAAFAFFSSPVAALQQAPPADSTANLRVYLDCRRCDFDYIRREVPVVDYVRDRMDADVHVLVTQQQTGSGGQEYQLTFLGERRLAGRADTLTYVSRQSDTDDEVRAGYTRILALGLVRYMAYAASLDDVDLVFRNGNEETDRPPASDPWNLWVMRTRASVQLEGESQTRSTEFSGSFTASRTTEDLKVDLSARGQYNHEVYKLSDDTTRVSRRNVSLNGTAVWSLGPHWSWGVSGSVGAQTRQNQSLFVHASPALEYSIYPYQESSRRQITFLYRVGFASYRYAQPTLFERTAETRPEERLEVAAEFRQPWGNLNVSLQASNYLDDFRQHRIELFNNLDFRILRGLSLNVRGSVARIKDQIYEPLEAASDQDILLQQRELGTDYRFSVDVGLSVTFGSVFNNIVNPRMRGGDRHFF